MIIIPSNDTFIGKREEQQDRFFINDVTDDQVLYREGALAVVADGMGGMSFGNLASTVAIKAFHERYTRESVDTPDGPIPERLLVAVDHANSEVAAMAAEKELIDEVGTTLVSVVIKGKQLYWISIGDSRAYLYRDGELVRLSRDHNYENELRKGGFDKLDAEGRREAQALTSYLGARELLDVDQNLRPLSLLDEDRVLICSDGLYGTVSHEEMLRIFRESEPERTASALMDAVKGRDLPHQDNATIAVLTLKPEPTLQDVKVLGTETQKSGVTESPTGITQLAAEFDFTEEITRMDIGLLKKAVPALIILLVGGVFVAASLFLRQAGQQDTLPAEHFSSTWTFPPDIEAVDDTVQLYEEEDTVISVLVNDVVPDSISPTLSILIGPKKGVAHVANDQIYYVPGQEEEGKDSLLYALDVGDHRFMAQVRMSILPVNDLPVAVSDRAETAPGESVYVDVLANDGDPDSELQALALELTELPLRGSLFVDEENGKLVYTPRQEARGVDQFEYRVTDDSGGQAYGRVTVVISPDEAGRKINTPPVAIDDILHYPFSPREIRIYPLRNDFDEDGDSLKLSGAPIWPEYGHIRRESDTTLIYVPAPWDTEVPYQDVFVYSVSDGLQTKRGIISLRFALPESTQGSLGPETGFP